MIAFLRSLLTWRKLLGLAIVLVLCALVLFLGSRLELWRGNPLGSQARRIGLVLVILVSWLLAELVPWIWHRRHEAKLLRSLVRDGSTAGTSEEEDELQSSLQETLAFLRRANPQRNPFTSYAYVLPWYMIVGPSGAGKTELVRQAGLAMPLVERLGDGLTTRIDGTGTRWWFTEDAVLVGVAGQTVQDAEVSTAAGPWRAVLEFLLRHRSRKPLNGIVAVVSAELLLGEDAHKAAPILRRRLLEASRLLQIQLQVYVVITQCDRLPGFIEAFDDLDEAARQGPLGALLPLRGGIRYPGGQHTALQVEFDAALARVIEALPGRAASELDPVRRARLIGFSDQLAALGTAVNAFVGNLLRPGRYDRPLSVRGTFLTASPTGPDVPLLDAWGERFASAAGLSPLPASVAAKGSFFTGGLFHDAIFPEAGRAGGNARREARLWTGYFAAYAALGLLASALIYLSFTEYTDHTRTLAQYRQVSAEVARLVADVRDRGDVDALLPLLNTSRRLTELDDNDTPSEREIGVSPLDIAVAGRASDASYRHVLLTYYLPALQAMLARQLQAAISVGVDRQRIRSLLTVYLMLGDPGHFDASTVAAWGDASLAALYPYNVTRRRNAAEHWRALVALLPFPAEPNPDLVAEARSLLAQRPTAAQIFGRLQQIALANPGSPNLDVAAALGSSGSQLLMLRPQAGLSVVVPGLFTRDGFYQVFLPDAPRLAKSQSAGDWIMGSYFSGTQADTAEVLRQVTNLYVQNYIRAWSSVTGQIYLQALPDIGSLQAALQTLSGPDSPLVTLLQLVRQQTDLPLPASSSSSVVQQAATTAGTQAGVGPTAARAAATAAEAILQPDPARQFLSMLAGKDWPGDRIKAPFLPLQALLPAPNGQAPNLQLQNTLATAFGVVSGIASGADPQQDAERLMSKIISGEAADPFLPLSVQSAILPRPLAGVFRELYASSWSLLMQMSLAYVQGVWARDVDPICEATIAQRYPFTQDGSGAAEVSISDFTNFFAPGGVLDKFVSGNLAMFTVPGPSGQLNLLSRNGLSLGVSGQALDQINRARRFQGAFFGRGGTAAARMWLTPSYLDYRLVSSRISYGDTTLLYQHGPPVSAQFDWPPLSDTATASLQVQTVGGETRQVGAQGAWSLFRLLDMAKASGGVAPDRALFTFTLDGFGASYALRAAGVANPFTSSDFRAFRCVPRL